MNLKEYYEIERLAEEKKQEAKRDLNDQLNDMSEIIREKIQDAMKEIQEKHGWKPPSIEVEMISTSTVSNPCQFELGAVTAGVGGL